MRNGIDLCNLSRLAAYDYLYSKGAVAVKPVGPGLEGYVLSLWNENPKKYIDMYLTLTMP